jgi:cobalt-zinc-cadmium efflux system membrane fusion protein
MIALLLAGLVSAHGGEDHGEPAASTLTVSADTLNVTASSETLDAVLRFRRGPVGAPAQTTLLLADWTTSAPVEHATPSLTLSGPGTVQVDFASTPQPGVYTGTATLPAVGQYAGALVVTTPEVSDLLSVSGLDVDAPSADVASAAKVPVGIVMLIAAVGVLGVAIGWLVGRRRGAAAAALLASAIVGPRVWAHGGEDHGAPGASAAPSGGGLTLPMESQFLLGLRTRRITNDVFQDQVEALGRFTSRPGGSATLRSPVAGTVVAPPGGFPNPGQLVHAGDVLAIVRETPTSADRASLVQQRADAANAAAEARKALALAERDAAQIATLGEGISERERLERVQSVEVARERVEQAELALAGIGTGATVSVRAPLAGRLGPATARPGDQVEPGDPLFRVVDPTGLWMEARVPERHALGLTAGATADVLSPADPSRHLHALVLDAGQEADPSTGTVLVTLAVEDEGTGLRAGMGATAWIGTGGTRDALLVPDAAVVDSNGASLAFVKTGPETFEMREIKLGGRAASSWEVLGGLRAGERVVVDGTYTLRSLAGR